MYNVRFTYLFQSTPLKSMPHDSILSLNQLSTLDQKSSPCEMRPLATLLLRFLAGASCSAASSFSETSSSSTPSMVLFSHANRRYNFLSATIECRKRKYKLYQDHIVDEITLLKCTRLHSLPIPNARVYCELLNGALLLAYDAISNLSNIEQCNE